jgi:hypothetical protein
VSNAFAISLPRAKRKKKKPMSPETKIALILALFSLAFVIMDILFFVFIDAEVGYKLFYILCASLQSLVLNFWTKQFIALWKRDQSDD